MQYQCVGSFVIINEIARRKEFETYAAAREIFCRAMDLDIQVAGDIPEWVESVKDIVDLDVLKHTTKTAKLKAETDNAEGHVIVLTNAIFNGEVKYKV